MGHEKSPKPAKMHEDQGSAKDAKIQHKGMSHRSQQGQDCCSPKDFPMKSAMPGADKSKLSKGASLPTEGPFDAPSGKSAGKQWGVRRLHMLSVFDPRKGHNSSDVA